MTAMAGLGAELAAAPGSVSAWLGRPGRPPALAWQATAPHYAASMMKVAVLAALHRLVAAGTLDPAAEVPVHNAFVSAAPGAPAFGCDPAEDSDQAVWDRLGGTAPLGWLAERMIVRSGNLATNLVLAEVGLAAVDEVWRLAGARSSVTGRGIEDQAARAAGITNVVTAADLAALLGAIALSVAGGHPIADRASGRAMIDLLAAQEHRDDLAAGLPAGTRVAHKSGWVTGVRHSAGAVYPDDAPPFVVAVCTTTPWSDAVARDLIARAAAAAWHDRHHLDPA